MISINQIYKTLGLTEFEEAMRMIDYVKKKCENYDKEIVLNCLDIVNDWSKLVPEDDSIDLDKICKYHKKIQSLRGKLLVRLIESFDEEIKPNKQLIKTK